MSERRERMGAVYGADLERTARRWILALDTVRSVRDAEDASELADARLAFEGAVLAWVHHRSKPVAPPINEADAVALWRALGLGESLPTASHAHTIIDWFNERVER